MSRSARPVVSVIIPTYSDRARFLKRALASIYAQRGAGEQFELEVIVADNASSPATVAVIGEYPSLRHLRFGTNRGLWPALNAGLEAATGRFVAFLIDDDLWLEHKLSVQVPILESQHEVGVVYGQQIVTFRDDVSVWPDAKAPSGAVFRALLLGNFVGERSILVHREAFETVGYFDEGLSAYGDYDMWLRLARRFTFTFVASPVAMYLRSVHGMYSTDIAERRTERELPLVLERALATLPATEPGLAELRRNVLVRAALVLAKEHASMKQWGRVEAHVIRALSEFTWIAGEPWARRPIVSHACQCALASPFPIEAATTFCDAVSAASAGKGLRDRFMVRRLLADVWAQLAISLGPTGPAAGYAAARAVRSYPVRLRRPDLLWVMARAGLDQLRTAQRLTPPPAHRND
jgi:hypothetical protein